MELIAAAKNGNFELVFNLLQSGSSTNSCDKDNATPLYWSACHGHASICEILIEAGSDVNNRVKWGSTALHAAADRGHQACIEVLLESGAQINARNSRGDTALHIAAYRGHLDIIMTLLRADADVTLRNEKGKTPRQEALEGGHRQIAENIDNFSKGVFIPHRLSPSRAADVISLRQPAEVCDEEQIGHDYENTFVLGRHGHQHVHRQDSLDTPHLRPPLGLCRSASVNDTMLRQNTGFTQSRLTDGVIEPRTTSLGSFPGYDVNRCVNDISRCFQVDDMVDGNHVFISQNDSLSQASYLTESSAYGSDASILTSCSENDLNDSLEYLTPTSRDVTQVQQRLRKHFTRPNSSSIGSLREISNESLDISGSPESQGSVIALQRQLVESYKTIERLNAENESLKFKCSTLLSRLSETERTCSERQLECEHLKQLLDSSVKNESGIISLNTGSTSEIHENKSHGFKQFCEHLSKEMTDDVITDYLDILRDSVQNYAVCGTPDLEIIDAPHREWIPGLDYVILGPQPATEHRCGQTDALPKSLSFQIKHLKTSNKFQLKMLVQNRISPLNQSRNSEQDILERIGIHKNVTCILHQYIGSTERFKKFLPMCFTEEHSLEDDYSNRTSFIITQHLPTLSSFLKSSTTLKSSGLTSVFLTHALYQLLALISLLEEMNISHNNINTNNVFVGNELNPVLGNFECATCLDEKPCERFAAENNEDGPDYMNVTHLKRGSEAQTPYAHRRPCSDLRQLCMFFDRLLMTETPVSTCSTDDTLTDNVLTVPPDVWCVIHDVITQSQNFTTKECLHRVGFALFGPKHQEATNQFQCRTFIQTRMLKILSSKPERTPPSDRDKDIQQCVRRNMYEIEAHFLCNITTKQFWDLRRTSKQ